MGENRNGKKKRKAGTILGTLDYRFLLSLVPRHEERYELVFLKSPSGYVWLLS